MKSLDSIIQEKFIINKNSHAGLKSEFKKKYGAGDFIQIKDLQNTLNCSPKIENIIIDKYLGILDGNYNFISSNNISKNSNLLYLIKDSENFDSLLDQLGSLRDIFIYKEHEPLSSFILYYLKNTEYSCFIYMYTANKTKTFIVQEYGAKLKK